MRPEAVGEVLDPGDAVVAAFRDDVRCAELTGELLAWLVAAHGDDPLGAELAGGEHAEQPDGTRPLLIRVSGALACRFGALLRRPQASASRACPVSSPLLSGRFSSSGTSGSFGLRILNLPSKRNWGFPKL